MVNIAIRGQVRERNPLFQNRFFRRFFHMLEVVECEVQSAGSGVIVDSRQGYILTNNQVVDDADTIEVTTKGNRRFSARLVRRDPATDIAVLRIRGIPRWRRCRSATAIGCRSATSSSPLAIPSASVRR
ncbi:MAG: trypsin-like peptidase domain-containing protein [Inquilinus sp.]|uniref:trypsin-like peptidase domain-containing protein n=1 Tax=Inquilinus sp. TaxID=1932117 RepID=UPI003F2C59D2